MRVAAFGGEIDLEVHGPEHGPALVFLHGLTTDRRIMLEAFEPVFEQQPGWRRIYLDLPGHGASPAAPSFASADGLIGGLAELLREHAGPQPAVVAHSYGTYLALGVLREHGNLSGMFLVNAIVEPDVGRRRTPPQRHAVLQHGLSFADDLERQTFLAEATVGAQHVLEAFRRAVDPAHKATDREFLTAVRARYGMSAPWSAAVSGFDRPLHVVCGQNDYWSGFADAMELARLARECRFTVLPGAGHLLPLEATAPMRELFVIWLETLRATLSRRY